MCAVWSMFSLSLPVYNIHTKLHVCYMYVNFQNTYTSSCACCVYYTREHWLYVLLYKILRCEWSSGLLFRFDICMSLRATIAERSNTISTPNTLPITTSVLILCRSCGGGGGGQGLSNCEKFINQGMLSIDKLIHSSYSSKTFVLQT